MNIFNFKHSAKILTAGSLLLTTMCYPSIALSQSASKTTATAKASTDQRQAVAKFLAFYNAETYQTYFKNVPVLQYGFTTQTPCHSPRIGGFTGQASFDNFYSRYVFPVSTGHLGLILSHLVCAPYCLHARRRHRFILKPSSSRIHDASTLLQSLDFVCVHFSWCLVLQKWQISRHCFRVVVCFEFVQSAF